MQTNSVDDYDGELKELKSNATNLTDSLLALKKRIDDLEGRKAYTEHIRTDVKMTPGDETVKTSYDENTKVKTTIRTAWDPERNVHVETIEEKGEDGSIKTTKRVQVTERTVTTKTLHSLKATPNDNGGKPPSVEHWTLSKAEQLLINGEHKQAEPQVVGFRRKKGDNHLGVKLRAQDGHLVVDKIEADSPLGKQGLVRVGDSILEVNGKEVASESDFENFLKQAGEGITLKVVPNRMDSPRLIGDFVKASTDYEPNKDDQIPCKEIGLAFQAGDILQVINKEDASWWQARKVNDLSKVGLIPSKSFEETRNKNAPVHNANSLIPRTGVYEDVGRMSPYGRRVLVLVGATGVGRRTLKSMLLLHDRNNFATVTPYTSRAPKDSEQEGREYNFTKKDRLQKDIDQGKYLEWGEFNGNLYGTSTDSVRTVVRSGRMCVLDCTPQAISYLHNREFMPFIVFIAPPSLEELKQLYRVNPHRTKPKTDDDLRRTCEESANLQQQYQHLFDLVLVNRNVDVTFRRLIDALEGLKADTQWVPLSWLY